MRRSLMATLAVGVLGAIGLVAAPSRAEVQAPVELSGAEPNTTTAGDGVELEAKFVSSLGWVKPGEGYPFQVVVRNETADAVEGIEVTITAPPGAELLSASDAGATVTANEVTWTPEDLAAGTADEPTVSTLVVDARSLGLGEEPTIVWQDLSATATMTYDGGADDLVSSTHGPKVIPNDPTYDTARYGDRPFPVVPVAYTDRAAESSALDLAKKINDPDIPGSTFNLYQELSYGQLFPQASVPSADITTAGFDDYEPGFDFTAFGDETPNTCTGGLTYGNAPQAIGTPVYEERIKDGWYQLPGNTAYYGADANGSAVVGGQTGVNVLSVIDQGCGDIGKGVFDAAQIADPEIDYDDFDTDKDGVVDFFMMVFTGLGGNGDSQLNGLPPYDNIWPHSSSLESGFKDPVTGQRGYVTDDQLNSLEGVPQCWVDDGYDAQDDCAAEGGTGDDDLPVHVAVGPYNVNPESAIEKASVISHEYGHSLGLPDFYSGADRETYGDFTLMATDKSQSMDVFSRQELGWMIPTPLQDGTYSDMAESDTDLHHIDWQTPDGTPYSLEGEDVHNGPAWVAKLPQRKIIDADFVESQASGEQLWFSGAGNDFGCSPDKGHNLDLYLPELADVPGGTDVSLDFRSYWDMEWDFDYGFVLVSTDGGETFTSLASANGYSTPAAINPNTSGCLTDYGNGLTGTSGSYAAGTFMLDRVSSTYGDPTFVDDSYDLSDYAGQEGVVVRFSYATDPALTRPGWFIDDLSVSAGGDPIFQSDFESTGGPDDTHIFNGGCKEGFGTSRCTKGWQYTDTNSGSPADHAYYLEMRDRSSFDLAGMDQNDRDPITFQPGLLLVYTDESHGYGNFGTDDPPAQTPLDSQPEPGELFPDLSDATFTAADGDGHFDDEAWIDNYIDPRREQEGTPFLFDYGCLAFDVLKMSGNGEGPVTSPGDLTGDLDVETSDGCVPFDYGLGANAENRKPTAIAQAKSTDVLVGDPVQFDASGSFDDSDRPDELSYSWATAVGGAASADAGPAAAGDPIDARLSDPESPVTSATFSEPGEYVVHLFVTDTDGETATDDVVINVTDAPAEPTTPRAPADPTPAPAPAPAPASTSTGQTLPATGGTVLILPAAGLLVLALGIRRLTR